MDDSVRPKPRRVASRALITRVCGGAAIALGATGIGGWAFDLPALKRVSSGLATMKANTALCFLLGGFALVSYDLPAAGAHRLGQLAGTLVALVALATLIEYHAGWDDERIFRDPDTPPEFAPGRMAEATAWGFLMAGVRTWRRHLRVNLPPTILSSGDL